MEIKDSIMEQTVEANSALLKTIISDESLDNFNFSGVTREVVYDNVMSTLTVQSALVPTVRHRWREIAAMANPSLPVRAEEDSSDEDDEASLVEDINIFEAVTSACQHESYWNEDEHGRINRICSLDVFVGCPPHLHYRPSCHIPPVKEYVRGELVNRQVLTLFAGMFRKLWKAFYSGDKLRAWLQKQMSENPTYRLKLANILITLFNVEVQGRDYKEDALDDSLCKYCGIKQEFFDEALLPWSQHNFHCSRSPSLCRKTFCSCDCRLKYRKRHNASKCLMFHETAVEPHLICKNHRQHYYCTGSRTWYDCIEYPSGTIPCPCEAYWSTEQTRKEEKEYLEAIVFTFNK